MERQLDRLEMEPSVLDEPKSEASSRETRRVSLYFEPDLMQALTAHVIQERQYREGSNKNSFLVGLTRLLLTSPQGKTLQQYSQLSEKPLLETLEDLLNLVSRLPPEDVAKMAADSERNPMQMLTYLLKLGLKTYQKTLEPE